MKRNPDQRTVDLRTAYREKYGNDWWQDEDIKAQYRAERREIYRDGAPSNPTGRKRSAASKQTKSRPSVKKVSRQTARSESDALFKDTLSNFGKFSKWLGKPKANESFLEITRGEMVEQGKEIGGAQITAVIDTKDGVSEWHLQTTGVGGELYLSGSVNGEDFNTLLSDTDVDDLELLYEGFMNWALAAQTDGTFRIRGSMHRGSSQAKKMLEEDVDSDFQEKLSHFARHPSGKTKKQLSPTKAKKIAKQALKDLGIEIGRWTSMYDGQGFGAKVKNGTLDGEKVKIVITMHADYWDVAFTEDKTNPKGLLSEVGGVYHFYAQKEFGDLVKLMANYYLGAKEDVVRPPKDKQAQKNAKQMDKLVEFLEKELKEPFRFAVTKSSDGSVERIHVAPVIDGSVDEVISLGIYDDGVRIFMNNHPEEDIQGYYSTLKGMKRDIRKFIRQTKELLAEEDEDDAIAMLQIQKLPKKVQKAFFKIQGKLEELPDSYHNDMHLYYDHVIFDDHKGIALTVALLPSQKPGWSTAIIYIKPNTINIDIMAQKTKPKSKQYKLSSTTAAFNHIKKWIESNL